MNSFLSRLHADLRLTRLTRRGATHHPDDVQRFTHKEYPRMQHIALPQPSFDFSLMQALEERRSAFSGDPRTLLSIADCGNLFGSALRSHGKNKGRSYPSGGALYPIETYLISYAFEGGAGIYHYHPSKHGLEYLWPIPEPVELKDIVRRPESLPFSSLIVFTSVWGRSSAKYGDLAYQHALIEVGHMSQNILLVATGLGLQTRPTAGFDDERLIGLLDIDASLEQPVHAITVCKNQPKHAANDSYSEE